MGGGGWLRADVYAACSVWVVGLSCGDVDSCQDDPQYKLMKYLVFGTILSSPGENPECVCLLLQDLLQNLLQRPGCSRGILGIFVCVTVFFCFLNE